MGAHSPGLVRAVALVGPTGTGKTNLMEALLQAAGAKSARGGIGDSSPEAILELSRLMKQAGS